MAKKPNKYDKIELTSAQLKAITDRLNAAGKNTYENWEKAVREATEAERQAAMEKDLLAEWEKTLQQLQEYYTNYGFSIGGARTASEEAYGNTLAKFVRKMQDAGLDPYSFNRLDQDTPLSRLVSDVRTAVEAASERGWGLPLDDDINWEPYVNKYQDELYEQRLNNGSDRAQFNFGLSAGTNLDGLDEAALQRNAMLPQIPVREDTPEQEDYITRLSELIAQNPGLTGDEYRAMMGEDSPYQNILTKPAEEPPVEHQYGVLGSVGPGYGDLENLITSNLNTPTSTHALSYTPHGARATRGLVTPEEVREAARNSTPGWMSDEFEDINTRAVNENPGDVQWTQAGQDYRDQLAAAMSGNTRPANTSAEGAASTGTAYQDYLASLSAQGGASAGTSGSSRTGYRTSGGKRNMTPEIQQDAYRSMLDALVRGSNGGMPTSYGMSAANSIYDGLRGQITDPKPAYEQYGAYRGNTLTRDKDYNYLNRLLNIKK